MNRTILNAAHSSSRMRASLALCNISLAPRRTFMTLKDVKYTATATAEGAGRNGTATSDGLNLKLALPKELGGSGNGQNPEQLFAMGYSACLLGAIQLVARQMGKSEMAKNARVHVSAHLGEPNDMPGFGIGVNIEVEGIDDELLAAGHAMCPYSRALKYGLDVKATTK